MTGGISSRSASTCNFPTGPKTFAGYPTSRESIPSRSSRSWATSPGGSSLRPGIQLDRRPHRSEARDDVLFDIGLGYFVYRSQNPRAMISFIVPVFETHLNIPLNWVGFQPHYIGGTPDVVDLTFGLNVGMSNKPSSRRPISGPSPVPCRSAASSP